MDHPTASDSMSSDQQARQRIRESLDESLIVEAGAGTGKTSELVRRIVRVLAEGRAEVGNIVAVTFTRKAAGELKLRLRQGLDSARSDSTDPHARVHLEQAMVRLEEAHIGTIHSFCADILRERPVEAGIQPGFEELDEKEAPRLFGRVFQRWAEDTLNRPPPGLRRALERAASWEASRTPLEQIRGAAWRLIEWRDFPSPWRREPFDREAEIDRLVPALTDLAGMAMSSTKPRDNLRQSLAPAVDFLSRIERAEAVRVRDYDEMEALLVQVGLRLKRNRKKGRGAFSDRFTRQEVLDRREEVTALLEEFRIRSDAELASLLRDELWELVDLYNDAKMRAGKLDFVDLLIATRDLIRNDAAVRRFLQQRFTHLFVDEFQDTDPLQAEILVLLAADDPDENDWRRVGPVAGKLFLVGDPKQSIYRFRRADVVLYHALRKDLTARGVRLVYLSQSFRSVPAIQRAVNIAFQPEMNGDPESGQPSYVALEEHATAIPSQPGVIALPVPRPYRWNYVTKRAVEESLPDTVGAFVDWLLNESGWRVRDPGNSASEIPIASQHVCLLFRRFLSWGRDITRDYVQALETRNVPHLLWGAKSFHQREEVETMRAALTALEWPDDELAVYATLKGSLFAVPDALLLRYRKTIGSLHPFRLVPDDAGADFEPIREALEILRELHRQRNWRPFVETIDELLDRTRAHAGFALRPAGNQKLANVYRVGDLARSFEARGGSSFRGFVELLTAESETEGGGESPVLEEGAEGVRIMTVHAAKGLEFPVVILADMTANLATVSPDKHVDAERGLAAMRILGCSPWELQDNSEREHRRDEAEGVRVAYVAATRARDILVVPSIGDEEMAGWIGALNKSVYPAAAARRQATTARGCPPFGESSVLERPANLMGHDEHSVKPGLHRHPGDYDVVWWDPAALKLDAEGNFGVRQEGMLAKDEESKAAERSMNEYSAWKQQRGALLEQGSAPSLDVFTASEAASPPPGDPATVEVFEVERIGSRPAGPRFGTLVHALLQDAAFDASRDALQRLAGFQARLLDAPPAETAAGVEAVERALGHPLMARVRRAARVHREYPVTFKSDDGPILEGVIDLAFLEDDVWQIVDFKTDVDIEPRIEEYTLQVGWYVHAIERITGLAARGYLLRV